MAREYQGVDTCHLWIQVCPNWSCKVVFFIAVTVKTRKKNTTIPGAAWKKIPLEQRWSSTIPLMCSDLWVIILHTEQITHEQSEGSASPVPWENELKLPHAVFSLSFFELHDNICRNFWHSSGFREPTPLVDRNVAQGWEGSVRLQCRQHLTLQKDQV